MDGESETLVPLLARSLTARNDGSPYADRGPDVIPVGFNARQDPDSWSDRTGTLDTDGGTQAVQAHGVRRLTPRECERLQGFPDDWTAVTHRGKPVADGPRYKALGNSMAVPVMRWIGDRIEKMDLLFLPLESFFDDDLPPHSADVVDFDLLRLQGSFSKGSNQQTN